jgi:hypothetical protein
MLGCLHTVSVPSYLRAIAYQIGLNFASDITLSTNPMDFLRWLELA